MASQRKRSLNQFIFVGLISVIIFIVMVIATHNLLTEPFPGHNDFLSRWEGSRSFWVDGLNPYGNEASLNIQNFMYGRPAMPDEDQVLFAYPMYTAILLLPLVFTNYAWASAIIMVIMEAMLLAALFLLLDLFKFRPKAIVLLLLLLIALLHYTAARGLILGQLGLVCYFGFALTFWGLGKEHDRIAGVALSLATIKPQLGFLIVPFLFLWGIRANRWQFVGSFVVSMLVLVGVSFVFVPTWLIDMWGQVTAYGGYAPSTPNERLFTDFLGLPANSQYILFAVLWGAMLITWYQVLVQGKLERAMWAAMVTLTVSNIAAPVVATPHFTVFMIPLIFYLKHLNRQRQYKKWIIPMLLVILVEPWIRFLLTLEAESQLEHWFIYFPEPIVILVSLWIFRELWWTDGSVLRHTKEVEDSLKPETVVSS
ncbi:MAG: glycosyltransferase family 87 protein [Chloroflexota bacterium]